MFQVKLSEATAARRRIPVLLVDITDGFTPETGVVTPTINISKNGATVATGAGTWTEIGNGQYYYEFTTGEVNTLGWIAVNIEKATVSRDYNAVVQIMAYDALDSVRLGLTALPNAAAGAAGGLPTGNASGEVTVGSLATTAQTNTAAAVWNALLASYTTANSFGARVVRTLSSSTTNEVTIGASNHIAANVHAMQNDVITAAVIAADAITSAELSSTAVQEIADTVLTSSLATAGAVNNIAITSIVSNVFQATNTLAVDDRVTFVGTAPAMLTLGAIYWVISGSLTSTTFTLSTTQGGLGVATSSTGAFTATKVTGRDMLSAMRYLRNKVDISGSTMTVYQEDDTSAAWNAALTTTAGLNPVTSLDPS